MACLPQRLLQCHAPWLSPTSSIKGVSSLMGSETQGHHQWLFSSCQGQKGSYLFKRGGNGVRAAEPFLFHAFHPLQWLPAPHVGRSGGAAAPCSTSTVPASPGGCAGMASSIASAGPMSMSADHEVLALSSIGDHRILPALSPLSPDVFLLCHPLGELQPKQILSSSTLTSTQ